MIFELIIFVTVVLLVSDYLYKKPFEEKAKNLKWLPTLPFFGSLHGLLKATPENLINVVHEVEKKYGRLFCCWIFRKLVVYVSDPQCIETILSHSKQITKHSFYNLLNNWLGTGLLLSTGQKWHSRRKIITPTFHFKILEQFLEIFDQQSCVLVKLLESHADGKRDFNVYPYICNAALDIIAETAMGTKINAQTDSDCDYVKAVTDVTNITAYRFTRPHLANKYLFALLKPQLMLREKRNIKLMHGFTKNIIEKRRLILEKSIADKTFRTMDLTDSDFGVKSRYALLDVLLQSTINGKPLSNEDIREEVDTFMFEGHDTTTASICYTLTLLSRYPEIQSQLFEEIRTIFCNDKSRSVTIRDFQNMKYLDCVIKESLRMYPPVPFIGRLLDEDLSLNGRVVPAGAEIIVGIYAAQHDPDTFPDPNMFKPDRFMSDENRTEGTFSYVPFSAGPRNCIGQKFAMLEMKCILTKILRYYELIPLGQEVKPIMSIVLRSNTGFSIGLKSRDN